MYERGFVLWSFSASHAHLILKSLAEGDEKTLDLVFIAVAAMTLRGQYGPPLIVERSSPEALEGMFHLAGFGSSGRGYLHGYSFGVGGEGGHVLCAGGYVLSLDRARERSSSGVTQEGVELVGHLEK
ncbi:hypothetical protein [Herbidospora mongoliensis]|uniref:hypothetical protein n=1 Tax=Herbidospora mongoliensis TaxID=688067 RepID=UPI0008372735|nr:hypothetical protein [Herbidospora mongoliensis]